MRPGDWADRPSATYPPAVTLPSGAASATVYSSGRAHVTSESVLTS
jgi:hypothetical protein